MSLVVTTSLPASKESSRTLGDSHFCNCNYPLFFFQVKKNNFLKFDKSLIKKWYKL
jgi:hypothetical protein